MDKPLLKKRSVHSNTLYARALWFKTLHIVLSLLVKKRYPDFFKKKSRTAPSSTKEELGSLATSQQSDPELQGYFFMHSSCLKYSFFGL